MKRNHLLTAIFTLLLLAGTAPRIQAQTFTKHVITFNDKNGSPYTIGNPHAYLSPKAIQRRRRQGIAIQTSDLPVSPRYVDSLKAVPGVDILYTSRWFNQAVIQVANPAALQKVQTFSFVSATSAIAGRVAAPNGEAAVKFNARTASYDYGSATGQISIHEGAYLHDKGFTGDGMLIAVLDAGFPGVNTAAPFKHLSERGRIKGTRDFVSGGNNVYTSSTHGTLCLSTMAARSAQMTGTAPNASYVLLRTEEDGKEQPIEENNWIAGAEYADSIGADVISSSLGYTTFDNPSFNHTYFDLTGDATQITQAADMAAAKGMIVVNSAGNEGNSSWIYITPPADGDSVLAVGAVNAAGQAVSFSGYGPTADGVIKPDVVGVGAGTQLIAPGGQLTAGNGTSYATPIVAGLVTCLWQAFPQRTNMEIINVVKASSSHFQTPEDQIGYGIPNFRMAYDSLYRRSQQDTAFIRGLLKEETLKVTPNPFYSQLYIYYQSASNEDVHLRLVDNNGKTLAQRKVFGTEAAYGYYSWQEATFSGLPAGIYYLQFIQGRKKRTARVLKL
ncbi:S8 family serine peptidase [Chitinophaga horti]|uniref:S8 family serine peptidase n=1 Tax=Chitinophaga horti TaxID=2920382 RepID=A0ABY6J0Z6_9BACT|nr:S8 family serine peptidase [Chitinophaga horti]UYQ91817.1 S8 family serine peptidase [Chitinophaga horti]